VELGNAVGVQGDVSSLADLDRIHDIIEQQKGRVDVLFAKAGGEFAPLSEIIEEHFDRTFVERSIRKAASFWTPLRLDKCSGKDAIGVPCVAGHPCAPDESLMTRRVHGSGILRQRPA